MSGKITAIERAAEGSPLTVYVDGKPLLEVSEEIARRLRLEVGMELSAAHRDGGPAEVDSTVAGLPPGPAEPGGDGSANDGAVGSRRFDSFADEVSAAREAALRLLAVRARSVSELRDRLRRKGFAGRALEETIEGLESSGLLDDGAFARLWADERVRLRPVGPLRLRQELIAKRVPGSIIDEVVRETFEEHDEVELALRAIARRVRGDVRTRAESARLHAYLVRRGFTFDAAAQALKRLKVETDDAEADL